jgi:hypothetical protein
LAAGPEVSGATGNRRIIKNGKCKMKNAGIKELKNLKICQFKIRQLTPSIDLFLAAT